MLYRKNVGRTEAIARALAGALLIAAGLWWLRTSPWGWAALATGATALATGWIGFCPACALLGRRSIE
ncbi:YgaP-like transmembrane domain [Paenacidovorax monticola]|uniref:DUF2892 domain-containing protein n=1 Tax=Paenacidovorax monticola TaxID=1926868 RepID=A0A7H0HBX1_9BURK|nr:YgaP-like transmembrane domain [Paenacidovorax monticola]MBO9680620.1 DUF2892 domain-containing protein [Acidovorax sp.]QNP58037.1 DUF2892 domain-containing protein [Paenacidovorax monticola]